MAAFKCTLKDVADGNGAYTCWGAGIYKVTGAKQHKIGDIRYHTVDTAQHIACVAVLHHFAIACQ